MIEKHNKCIKLLELRKEFESNLNQLTILLDVYKSNPLDHTVMFYKYGEIEKLISIKERQLRVVNSKYLRIMMQLRYEFKY